MEKIFPESAISLTTDEWKLYCTGEYLRNPATGQPEKIITEEPILEPSQLREQAYKNNPLITWQNESITVDQANQVYLQYSAEGSPRAEEMQELIVSTKAQGKCARDDSDGGAFQNDKRYQLTNIPLDSKVIS